MTHVLSFDVRAWDPESGIDQLLRRRVRNDFAIPAGDPGYLQTAVNWLSLLASNPPTTPYAIAAAVDLYYSGCLKDFFNRNPSILNPNTFNPAENYLFTRLTGSTFAGPGNANSLFFGTFRRCCKPVHSRRLRHWFLALRERRHRPRADDQSQRRHDSIADEGTNGLDDNNDGVVDDLGEFEAPPPYFDTVRGGYPLTGRADQDSLL